MAFFDPQVLGRTKAALPEVAQQRLLAVDRAGISIAVLSQTAPGVQAMEDAVPAVELAHRA